MQDEIYKKNDTQKVCIKSKTKLTKENVDAQ